MFYIEIMIKYPPKIEQKALSNFLTFLHIKEEFKSSTESEKVEWMTFKKGTKQILTWRIAPLCAKQINIISNPLIYNKQ